MKQSNPNEWDEAAIRRLADFDEGLRLGHPTAEPMNANDPALAAPLKEAQEFLQLLEAVWPRGQSAVADETPLPSLLHSIPRRIGRFEVQRVLGHGGTGVVYLARDPLLDRNVAIKVPRLEMVLSAQLRQRFVREAKVAALLNHPNIVPILEVSEADDLCFIVGNRHPKGTHLGMQNGPTGVQGYTI